MRIYGARPSGCRSTLIGTAMGTSGLPSPAATVDQRRWCSFVDSQDGERCVGQAFAGAAWVANGNQGQRFSDLCIWTEGRAREVARKGDPVLDVGMDPADAPDAMIDSGVCAREADDEDATRDTGRLNVEEVVAASKHKFDPGWFLPMADGDVTTGQQVLTMGATQTSSGIVIPFSMPVDTAYEALNSTNPVYSGPSGAVLGNHMQCWVGYTTINGKPHAIVWNSWGTQFADGGFSYIPLDAFARLAVSLIGVLKAPVIPARAS